MVALILCVRDIPTAVREIDGSVFHIGGPGQFYKNVGTDPVAHLGCAH